MNLSELQSFYDFTNRTLLLTGGAGVLGFEIARTLVACNANVAVLSRDREKAAKCIGEIIKAAGGNHPSATTSNELSFFDLPQDALQHVGDPNLLGTMLPCQVFGRGIAQRGDGVMEDGIEKPNVRVTLASKISEEDCTRLNLGDIDPAKINVNDWKDKEDEGILFVPKAGEILFRTT